ncbi:MAG: PCP reductase family protein [Longimicrobiales bacterium]|nr:PCP reductase family protein [Longimicrobiales bacterium]
MKFLCVDCDHVMDFSDRDIPGDGTMAALFTCGRCGREVAMLTNPMETQLVSSLGVKVGGREVPGQPMELTRTQVADGRDDAFDDAAAPSSSEAPIRVTWSDDAVERLQQVPSFVRGMVKRIYTDYARERGIDSITPAVMDRARTDLGLEGM